MKQRTMTAEGSVKPLDSAFMWRVFYAFAALALLSVAISVGGKWLGKSIALAGHTDDTTIHEIVIGNNVISAPANAIRFERDRTDRRRRPARPLSALARYARLQRGDAQRLQQFEWRQAHHLPVVRGAHDVARHERALRADLPLADRYAREHPVPPALTYFNFSKKSGYLNEVLAVAARPGEDPFVARCLSGPSAEESLAPCERDIHVGDDLSLSYRFPAELA